MNVLVTGSSGHLGEALVRTLPAHHYQVVGIDRIPGPFTHRVGSITDRSFVEQCLQGIDAVIHTATLHKPHVATHTYQDFVDTNITGTLHLLEEAQRAGLSAFVFTSTTSTFGDALTPRPGAPAVWVDEDLAPIPKNIYGATKTAAEDLCQLFHRNHGLPCLVLRTSRFFPEEDDQVTRRQAFADDNLKVNELLHRRVDLADAVDAHRLALEKAPALGFGRYIISTTTPFARHHQHRLINDAPGVVQELFPGSEAEYTRRGWALFPKIDRVYDNQRARAALGWEPVYTFRHVLDLLKAEKDWRSPLARGVGVKGYHDRPFAEGPYPVEQGTAGMRDRIRQQR